MHKQITAGLAAFMSMAHIVMAQSNTNLEHKVRYSSNEINCSDLAKILNVATWKFETRVPRKTGWFPVTLSWYESNTVARVLGKANVSVAFAEEASKEHKDTLVVALQPLDGKTFLTASRIKFSCSGFNCPGTSFVFDNPFLSSNEGVHTLGSPEQVDECTFKVLASGSAGQKHDIRIRIDLDAWEGKYQK